MEVRAGRRQWEKEQGHGNLSKHSRFNGRALYAPHKPRKPLPNHSRASHFRTSTPPLLLQFHVRSTQILADLDCRARWVLATLRKPCTPRADAGPLTTNGRRLRRRETHSGCCRGSTCSASSLGICGASTPESTPFRDSSQPAPRRRASS